VEGITIAAIEPLACMAVMDKLGRRPLLSKSKWMRSVTDLAAVAANAGCAVTMSLLAALSKYYGSPTGTITAGGGALASFSMRKGKSTSRLISAQIAFIYLTLIAYLLCEAVRTGSICAFAHGMARPTSSTLERFGLPTVRAHRGATLLTLHSVRAKGAAIGLASINWATPYALVSITWRYWIVRHFHHRGFGIVDLD
jgi:hypothetical protein